MDAVLNQLRAEGFDVRAEDVALRPWSETPLPCRQRQADYLPTRDKWIMGVADAETVLQAAADFAF